MSAPDSKDALSAARLEAAREDLDGVRETLRAATHGDADAVALTDSLRAYLDRHGPTLRSVGAAIGEEVRVQLLQQLYAWRSQLEAQLGSRPRPSQAETAARQPPVDET